MSKNKKVVIHSLLIILFSFAILNSWPIQDELSLVVYQRNSFCQLILYSLKKDFEFNHKICSNCNRINNNINLETDAIINSLSSTESLTSRGNMHCEQGALTYLFQGFSQIRTQYLNKLKNNHLKCSNSIKLKHITIGIEGYRGNETKKNDMRNEIIIDLIDKNFIIDKQSIIIADNLDLVKNVALEHSDNRLATNNLIVSLNSDITVNFKIEQSQANTNSSDTPITEEDILLNENLSGGYAQLGKETSILFDSDFINASKQDNKNILLENILATKINENLVIKKGINLVEWLSKSHGRDSARGLAIIDNFLNDDNDDIAKYSKHLHADNEDDINVVYIRNINNAINLSIAYNINSIESALQQQNYRAIVLGEFINNKYIRKKYLTKLNLLDENIRQRITILTGNTFNLLLCYAAEKIHYNYSNTNDYSATHDLPQIEDNIRFLSTLLSRYLNKYYF